MKLSRRGADGADNFADHPVKVGDQGISLSTLKPMGTIEFGAGRFEVKTLGDYVDVGTKVTIVHIQGNQVIVKPLN